MNAPPEAAPRRPLDGPQLIPDMPFATYLADPIAGGSLSSTQARRILPPGSPARVRWEQLHAETDTDALRMGRAVHDLILGNGAAITRLPGEDLRTKATRQAREEALAAGLIPVKPREYDLASAMAATVRRPPTLAKAFATGTPEVSIFWRDARTGCACRARVDWLHITAGGRAVAVDVKTTISADPREFAKSIATYAYHQQAAHYLDAITALGFEDPAWLFAVIEKTPPHDAVPIQLDGEALRVGRERNATARAIWTRCHTEDAWPGLDDTLHTVGLPYWALLAHEESTHG